MGSALTTIKLKLEEVGKCLDRLEKSGERGGKAKSVFGRCCGLMAQGHDVLSLEEEFDRLDSEIRRELEELVKATQLHAYSNRAAGVLKDKTARAFWDRDPALQVVYIRPVPLHGVGTVNIHVYILYSYCVYKTWRDKC